MRHHDNKGKLGRVRAQRVALLRSLARSVIIHGKIETTESKAKELRPFVEKMVTKAKLSSVASRRLLASRIGNGYALKKLIDDIGPKYKTRMGGYLRITKLWRNTSDSSKKAIIEFV